MGFEKCIYLKNNLNQNTGFVNLPGALFSQFCTQPKDISVLSITYYFCFILKNI